MPCLLTSPLQPQEHLIEHAAPVGPALQLPFAAPDTAVMSPVLFAPVDPEHLEGLGLLALMAPFGPRRDRDGYLLAGHVPSYVGGGEKMPS